MDRSRENYLFGRAAQNPFELRMVWPAPSPRGRTCPRTFAGLALICRSLPAVRALRDCGTRHSIRKAHRSTDSNLSINDMLLAYWRFAKTYYVKDGKPTKELTSMQEAIRPLRKLYGRSQGCEFGPKRGRKAKAPAAAHATLDAAFELVQKGRQPDARRAADRQAEGVPGEAVIEPAALLPGSTGFRARRLFFAPDGSRRADGNRRQRDPIISTSRPALVLTPAPTEHEPPVECPTHRGNADELHLDLYRTHGRKVVIAT
jgi:hypothetical protein